MLLLLSTNLVAEDGDSAAPGAMEKTDTMQQDSSMSETMTGDKPALATADLLLQQQQADIATAQNPETEIIWLDAGGQQRLALYQPSATPEAYAAVIIFPDTATSADWPDFIHPLRTALTDHGWSTLALHLPPESAEIAPERTLPSRLDSNNLQTDNSNAAADTTIDPAASAATESATDTPPASDSAADQQSQSDSMTAKSISEAPDYRQLMQEIGDAASRISIEKGHETQVLVGVGSGANWATQRFIDNQQENQYLVLIDPRNSLSPDAPALLPMITEMQGAMLDLWFNTTPYAREQARLRKRAAQRNAALQYTQIRINQRVDATGRQPQWLTKQVRGILQRYILEPMQQMENVTEETEAPTGQLMPGG